MKSGDFSGTPKTYILCKKKKKQPHYLLYPAEEVGKILNSEDSVRSLTHKSRQCVSFEQVYYCARLRSEVLYCYYIFQSVLCSPGGGVKLRERLPEVQAARC